MKITAECYPCLRRLVHQAAELATADPEVREKAIAHALTVLDSEFSLEKTSIAVATPLHRAIKELTANPDPYFAMKETEVAMAKQLHARLSTGQATDLRDAMVLAVRGNTIDFFLDMDHIVREMQSPVAFAIDDTDLLHERLERARRILYLADNSGEVFFDMALVKKLAEYGDVTYVVKAAPVQNDVTLADIDYFEMSCHLPRVITTGADTPGVVMEMASDEFRAEFLAADLVIAKGMGYWETLSELPAEGKVFHLLKAKCRPVADSIGVPLYSFVALLR